MLRYLCCLPRRFKSPSSFLRFSRGHTALATMPITSTDWNSHHDFFHLTSYRFVSDERHQMAVRNVHFNMNNLAKIAAASIGFEECTNVEKLDEGLFNKIFLFTMKDGSQVVGKVPCRNAGRPHFTTASEVATMDFARTVLETPVPTVLAWSSRAFENDVGAEYIIMEKAPGVELSTMWHEMDVPTKFKLIKALGRIQKAWASISFPRYGSIYYAADLESPKACVLTKQDGSQIEDPRFSIGPSNSQDLFSGGRGAIDFDRGPWDTIEQYEQAVGHREIACVEKMPELPQCHGALNGPRTYIPSRSRMLAALRSYLQLVPFMLPTDSSISTPFLWHDDLHTRNIFVNPEKPWQILSIIDWQLNTLKPLFDHAEQPSLLDYEGPPVKGLEKPTLPENLQEMSSEEQEKTRILYRHRALSALYRWQVNHRIPLLYKAMEYRETIPYAIIQFSQSILNGSEAIYQSFVKDLQEEWPTIPGVQAAGNPEFPIHFSEDEIRSIEKDAEGAFLAVDMMHNLKSSLSDVLMDHFEVRNEQYDTAKKLLINCKKEIMDELGCTEEERRLWDRVWPFDE